MTDGNASANPEIITETAYCGDQLRYFDNTYSYGGLTKREYFAAMALQGLLAHDPVVSIHGEESLGERMANWSVVYADALIEALNKT